MNIDSLVYSFVFSFSSEEKKKRGREIREMAKQKEIYLASIHQLYMAIGARKVKGFTVPAINIRTLTYDIARTIFRLMIDYAVGPVIFEIARSEQTYTQQDPDEYATVILAAAIKERYHGPVFIQGDHYQFSARAFAENKETEINAIKDLIKRSVEAGFYNIDIDASTLVDLSKESLDEQQKNNFEMTAHLIGYIRNIEPDGITVSIGGEIGHIGGKNSTVDDFRAFMRGLQQKGVSTEGISKVSVQTGTSHGGIPDVDGSIVKVQIDFAALEAIGHVAKDEFHIGGAVQHGASTLPEGLFHLFPKAETLEIHLATGFQNIVYDHLPSGLREKMYVWLQSSCAKERKPEWTDAQFYYKTRKKAFGPFKKDLWDLSDAEKKPIRSSLASAFLMLFSKLQVLNTAHSIAPYV